MAITKQAEVSQDFNHIRGPNHSVLDTRGTFIDPQIYIDLVDRHLADVIRQIRGDEYSTEELMNPTVGSRPFDLKRDEVIVLRTPESAEILFRKKDDGVRVLVSFFLRHEDRRSVIQTGPLQQHYHPHLDAYDVIDILRKYGSNSMLEQFCDELSEHLLDALGTEEDIAPVATVEAANADDNNADDEDIVETTTNGATCAITEAIEMSKQVEAKPVNVRSDAAAVQTDSIESRDVEVDETNLGEALRGAQSYGRSSGRKWGRAAKITGGVLLAGVVVTGAYLAAQAVLGTEQPASE